MNPIRYFWRQWCLCFYRWALREIHPLHEDVPYILFRIRELEHG
jgi:hypothetical protein